MGSRSMQHVNGVDLCVEQLGRPSDPTVLLIGGASMSMDWWEDEFCERLAAGGRHVVRFDLRDTGESTSSPAGAPSYGGDDLVADVLALLDLLTDGPAHLVGISMGGGIAQYVAIAHPERVASLTLLSTTAESAEGSDAPRLPGPTRAMSDWFAAPPPDPDWADRAAVVEHTLETLRPFSGGAGLDEEHARALVTRIVERTLDMAASSTNHWVLEGGPGPLRERLGTITAPTLVIHGTDDPLLPLPHGEMLAREIPGARLLPLAGVGHEVPPPSTWDVVVPAIVQHTGTTHPDLPEDT